MHRVRLPTLLAPAAVLYLLAEGASSQGELDPLGVVVALTAAAILLAPALLVRDRSVENARSLELLALTSAIALTRIAAPTGLSLALDLAHATCASAAAALVLALALALPNRFARRKRAWLSAAPFALGVVVACCALASILPSPTLFGRVWITPAWFAHAPNLALVLASVTATALRVTRPKLASTPAALAQNTWALLGLVPFTLTLVFALAIAALERELPALRAALGLSALALVVGHARALDPEQRLHAARTARAIVLGALTLGITAAIVQIFARYLQAESPAVLAAASVLLAAMTARALRLPVRELLAPARGRLLDAIEHAHEQLGRVSRLNDVAAVTLGALRLAGDDRSASALLYVPAPALELSLDAAGIAHAQPRTPHPELGRVLAERKGDLILRGPLEAQVVRNPPLRPLVAALVELDALCVLPLMSEGELEGALVLPRAGRRSQLTLEELSALEGLARHVASLLAVLAASARAELRAERADRLEREARSAVEEHATARARLEAELRAAYALAGSNVLEQKLIAYGPAMRSLLGELSEVATHDRPWLLTAERGLPVEACARAMHERSARSAKSCVFLQCAGLPLDDGLPALFGHALGDRRGAFELAAGSTLVLLDVPALAPEAQQRLAHVLAGGLSRSADLGEPYACDVRVLATQRESTSELLPALRACFAGVSRLPPLRERKEDLPSLCLLAVDRACRVLGVPPVGLAPDAQARLLEASLPDNLLQLERVIEGAVAVCRGTRVSLAEIETSLRSSEQARTASAERARNQSNAEHALDATLEDLEKQALARALERTGGNKSEAARLLGLKRTTFLDKLRRHGLEERPRGSAVN